MQPTIRKAQQVGSDLVFEILLAPEVLIAPEVQKKGLFKKAKVVKPAVIGPEVVATFTWGAEPPEGVSEADYHASIVDEIRRQLGLADVVEEVSPLSHLEDLAL